MKKALYALIGILAVFIIAFYVLLFTGFGNTIIASYAEGKIKELSGIEAKFNNFKLRPSSLNIDLDLANMAQVKLDGNLSLFSLGFDVDYLLSLNKDYAQNLNLRLERNLNFGGNIAGKIGDFTISGNGAFVGSDVNLKARIFEYNPLELQFAANNIQLEEILKLLSKPEYVKGNLNINADVKAKDLKADGKALINLATSSINYTLLQRDFNLSLPNSNISANIQSLIQDTTINSKIDILSSYMSFKTQNTKYELSDSSLMSDYQFLVPDLSKLEKLAGAKLKGNLKLDGNVSAKAGALQDLEALLLAKNFQFIQGINANDMLFLLSAKGDEKGDTIAYDAKLNSKLVSIPQLKGSYTLSNARLLSQLQVLVNDLSQFKGLAGVDIKGEAKLEASAQLSGSLLDKLDAKADIAGGKIEASSNGKSLDLAINALDLSKILALAAQPAYVSGNLNAKAHLASLDFEKLNGEYSLNANGILGQKALSAMLDKKFPANSKYDVNLKGDIKDSLVNFDMKLSSDLANLESFKGKFDLKTAVLTSNFSLNAYDFSKLGFLAERKLSGKAVFTGALGFDKLVNASIESANLFEGKLKANLANNNFKATISEVDFSTLMKGLDFPDYYEAKANVDLDYNLLTSSGLAKANLNNAKLKNVGIIKTASDLTKSDLTKDAFNAVVMNAQLKPDQIKLDIDMNSPRVNIAINSGLVNTKSGALNLPLSLGIDKANFKGTIKGTSSSPSLSIDVGSVLKGGVQKLLEKQGSGDVQKGLNKLLDKLF